MSLTTIKMPRYELTHLHDDSSTWLQNNSLDAMMMTPFGEPKKASYWIRINVSTTSMVGWPGYFALLRANTALLGDFLGYGGLQ